MSETDEIVRTPEEIAEMAEAQAVRLNATIRDALLTHIRSLKKPWEKLPQREQQDIINAVEETARHAIRECCSIIARRGFDNVPIVLKDFQVKEHRIKGKFEATMTADFVTTLAEHSEATAVIVLASPAMWMQGDWGQADPDQPDMIGDGEDEDEPDDDQRRATRRKAA